MCLQKVLFFHSSWVKKNVKETYGGDDEASDYLLAVEDTSLACTEFLLFFHVHKTTFERNCSL